MFENSIVMLKQLDKNYEEHPYALKRKKRTFRPNVRKSNYKNIFIRLGLLNIDIALTFEL